MLLSIATAIILIQSYFLNNTIYNNILSSGLPVSTLAHLQPVTHLTVRVILYKYKFNITLLLKIFLRVSIQLGWNPKSLTWPVWSCQFFLLYSNYLLLSLLCYCSWYIILHLGTITWHLEHHWEKRAPVRKRGHKHRNEHQKGIGLLKFLDDIRAIILKFWRKMTFNLEFYVPQLIKCKDEKKTFQSYKFLENILPMYSFLGSC